MRRMISGKKLRRLIGRRGLPAAAALIISISLAGSALAYFTDNEQHENLISVQDNRIEIVEEYEPPDPGEILQYKKAIAVKNTGEIPCYTRVRIAFSDDAVRRITSASPDGAAFYEMDKYPAHLPPGWVYIPEDESRKGQLLGGYFYYKTVLPEADGGESGREMTAKLTESFRTVFPSAEEAVPYDIFVYAESVQTIGKNGKAFAGENAWEEAWTEFLKGK